jgi:hypothetical protein
MTLIGLAWTSNERLKTEKFKYHVLKHKVRSINLTKYVQLYLQNIDDLKFTIQGKGEM